MYCYKCRQKQDTSIKIGFRAICPNCERDLHVCKNCRYYYPGKPNDCLIPGTEPVRDREAFNFCEDFVPGDKLPEEPKKAEDIEKKLFKL